MQITSGNRKGGGGCCLGLGESGGLHIDQGFNMKNGGNTAVLNTAVCARRAGYSLKGSSKENSRTMGELVAYQHMVHLPVA